MTLRRPALLLLLLGALALGVAACGGSDEESGGTNASSSTDVNELLSQTFSGSKEIKSGNLDAKVNIEAQGGNSQLDGPISISLSGPFQSQGGGALPEFSLDASLEGAGQSLKAGVTATDGKGYVSFQGTDYVLDDQIYQQFKSGYEQAQKQGADQKGQSFASLGMDPRKWLTDPQNAGEAEVGDDDTIKITGGVDVSKLLDDVNVALEKAASLGVSGAGAEVPQKLTEQQRKQVLDAVKDPKVEIYTGKDDQILRRMVVNLGIQDTGSGTSGTVALDISITDLNEDQDIAAPQDAKPFSDLAGQLGGLGLGAAGAGSGSSSGGTSDGSGAAGSSEDLQKYSECLTAAGSDVDKARKCAELLTP
jgi:hypothetical protein